MLTADTYLDSAQGERVKVFYFFVICYVTIAVLLITELILHGFTSYAWSFVFILVLGAVSFLLKNIAADRIARDVLRNSRLSGIDPEIKEMRRQMNEEIYGDEDEGKEPVTLSSRFLGTLTYRRRPGWYEGEAEWCRHRVKVILIKNINEDPSAALALLESYFKERKSIDRTLRGRVAERHNELRKRICPTNIYLTPEGKLELYYSDDPRYHQYRILGIYDGGHMKVKISR